MIVPRILVVDDEKEVRAQFSNFLAQRFICEIVERKDGKEALALLEAQEFHVILLDQRMPGIDGFTILEHVRRRTPQATVIMITGLGGAGVAHKVESLGGIYMAKPVSLKAIALTIRRELERRGGFDLQPAAR